MQIGTRIMYLDIETTKNPAMEPYRMDGASPPKRYKRPEAIDKWFAEEADRRLERMPLDIDHAQITVIAYAIDEKEPVVLSCLDSQDKEHELLGVFWTAWLAYDYPRFCGYNILDFDLPIIIRRSWRWGITPPRIIDLRRYSTDTVVDLMQLLYHKTMHLNHATKG